MCKGHPLGCRGGRTLLRACENIGGGCLVDEEATRETTTPTKESKNLDDEWQVERTER